MNDEKEKNWLLWKEAERAYSEEVRKQKARITRAKKTARKLATEDLKELLKVFEDELGARQQK